MPHLKSYLVSFGVLVVLTGGLVWLWPLVVGSAADVKIYLFGALLISAVLVAVNVLQLYHNSEDAAYMATRLLKDMLASSHELFFELYRGSPVPYLLVEKNGTITSANTSAIRLFGTKEGGLDGQTFFDLIDGENADHVALFSEKLSRGLAVNAEEVRVRREDGSFCWAICSFISFIDGQNIRRGLVTLVDISKQKQIDQAKTEFVSLASHQLRTPIASMKWNLELLLMKYEAELPLAAREYVNKSMESIGQMNSLVGDFLNASRFELGTLKYAKESIAIQTFIDTIAEDHMAPAEAKKVSVVKKYDPNISSIISDQRLLQMIVNNLISNAVKYTPTGGTVTIETSQSKNVVSIQVSDTGMGIPKSEQDRLFTKIFRASNAVASVPDGTGLGLYIADQSAKVLGGGITCVSEENVGTTFTVSLPQ